MELKQTLDQLAHATWAPADQRYLLAVSNRLEAMFEHEADFWSCLELELADLIRLPSELSALHKNGSELSRLELIAKSPAQENQDAKHPLHGLISIHPTYVLLVTKLPTSCALHDDFEALVKPIFMHIIRANLDRKRQQYEQSAAAIFRCEMSAGSKLAEVHEPPLSHAATRLSLLARKVVSSLADISAFDQMDSNQIKLWAQFERACKRFSPEPKQLRQQGIRQQSGRAKRENIYRSKASATFLESPLTLVANVPEVSAWAFEDHSEQVAYRVTHTVKKLAEEEDLDPYELIDEDWEVAQEVHEYCTPEAARVAGKFHAKHASNAAQLLRWSTANLTPETLHRLIYGLYKYAHEVSQNGVIAALILATIVTGRPLESLFPRGLKVADGLPGDEDMPSDVFAIFYPEADALALKVNAPNLSKVVPSKLTHQTKNFALVPDVLRVGKALERLGLVGAKFRNKTHIKAANNLLVETAEADLSVGKIWQVLPRVMQSESGMFSAMAMLTGWSTANSMVDLHYHTASAELVARRYTSAMGLIVPESIAVVTPRTNHNHLVGAPNLIRDDALKVLIKRFQNAFKANKSNATGTHNLSCLYTLFVCTAGFGLRHAINPDFTVSRYGDMAWVSSVEKGHHRQLLLPELVNQQLLKHDERLRLLKSRQLPKALLSEGKRFFLLDPHNPGKTLKLEPSKIGRHLQLYGIEFDLPLNSLRRWMFSALFEAGARTATTDYFGGHAAQGRVPLTSHSSVTIDAYVEAASAMNGILVDKGWVVL